MRKFIFNPQIDYSGLTRFFRNKFLQIPEISSPEKASWEMCTKLRSRCYLRDLHPNFSIVQERSESFRSFKDIWKFIPNGCSRKNSNLQRVQVSHILKKNWNGPLKGLNWLIQFSLNKFFPLQPLILYRLNHPCFFHFIPINAFSDSYPFTNVKASRVLFFL